MRKDLKIGMAIGAVLLVVLIIYVAVPKGDSGVAQNPDATVEPGGVPEQEDSAQPPIASIEETGIATADSGAGKAPTAPPDNTELVKRDTETTDPFKEPANEREYDWANMLVTGEMPTVTSTPPPPRLIAVTPTGQTADAGAASSSDPSSEPARTVPSTTDGDTAEPAGDLPSPQTSAGSRTHTIKSGENYSTIAKAAYGESRYYLTIQKANPTLDPARLKPGTVINLPDIDSIKAANSSSRDAVTAGSQEAAKPIDSENEYRVQSGDSLYKIALKRYGSSNMVDKLYEANKQTIGDDSSRLKIGMVLKLPPSASDLAQAR